MNTTQFDSIEQVLAASVAASGLEPVIDAQRCAQLLKCSKEHVEALADRGMLPATKFGRGWVFVTAQLLSHVAQRCAANLAADARRTPVAVPTEAEVSAQAAGAAKGHAAFDRVPVLAPRRGRGRPRLPVPV